MIEHECEFILPREQPHGKFSVMKERRPAAWPANPITELEGVRM